MLRSGRDLFLSKPNQVFLIKKFYQSNAKGGGNVPLARFNEIVPPLMIKWQGLRYADSYEDVSGEDLIALVAMNDDFVAQHEHVWRGKEVAKLPATWSFGVDDYRNMDNPLPEDRIVKLGDWHYGRFPTAQRRAMQSKNIDRSNDGFARGRSIEQVTRAYDMSEVLARVDEPYHRDAEPSYAHEGESVTTDLMDTSF
jgi:hypothetical protein